MKITNLYFSRIIGFPARLICRYSHPKMRMNVSKAVRIFLASLENYSYDFEDNGELQVIKLMHSKSIKTVFDVGANKGEWSVLVNGHLNPNYLFAFEIAPETFAYLQNKVLSFSNIKAYNIGMSDKEGRVSVFLGKEKASAFTSLHPIVQQDYRDTNIICCEVTTIDRFCIENSVKAIDWLKVDTEGHDFKVVMGAQQMLRSKQIRFVQFEYGKTSILTKDLLKDFHEFFNSIGYKVGKIYPKYIDFSDYSIQGGSEDFIGPNYLACTIEEWNDLGRKRFVSI